MVFNGLNHSPSHTCTSSYGELDSVTNFSHFLPIQTKVTCTPLTTPPFLSNVLLVNWHTNINFLALFNFLSHNPQQLLGIVQLSFSHPPIFLFAKIFQSPHASTASNAISIHSTHYVVVKYQQLTAKPTHLNLIHKSKRNNGNVWNK